MFGIILGMGGSAEPRLGVDFGRVIHNGQAEPGPEDTTFLDGDVVEAIRSPATDGAFDVLPRLVERFGGRVWVISKCGERIERRTRQWLDHHDFYRRTGIPHDHVRFCRERHEKADHCAELGITHMIDDHIEVHRALRGLVPNLYLFGYQPEQSPDWVIPASTWAEVEAVIGDITPRPDSTTKPRP